MYREEPVFVSNTLEDPRWHDLRHVAVNFGLMSCWSMPIRSGLRTRSLAPLPCPVSSRVRPAAFTARFWKLAPPSSALHWNNAVRPER
ncbi:GAF domain-containing protein [Paludibacterium denitrificans]|uniref:GAF domain-containing protein n=1 Tax=Paludibacterium denitrificans TaxID=2675226 RepID=UPI0035E41377